MYLSLFLISLRNHEFLMVFEGHNLSLKVGWRAVVRGTIQPHHPKFSQIFLSIPRTGLGNPIYFFFFYG